MSLLPLESLAWNYWWSWAPDGAAVFRDLDPELWEEYEHNPRELLARVSPYRLAEISSDPVYLERVQRLAQRFDTYMRAAPVSTPAITPEHPVAYFCAEFGIHNSLPNYSGGLGILAGDHLKSASDLNLPLTAIGLLYRYGYFRQSLRHDGWQEERYADVFASELALSPVLNGDGQRVTVSVHIRGREVVAQAWLASVGRISLYLLDTSVPQNNEVDRLITGHLYGGDTETRIVQEKVLGIGGVRLLRKLGIEPG